MLEWLLPPADADAGTVTGDLDEEYARFVRSVRGPLRAGLWYWRQVLLSAPRILVRRWSGRSDGGWVRGDVRHAFRLIRRRPGFAAATVLTLARGLGVNTSVFSVVNAVLMQPLPSAAADRLVRPLPDELFFLDSHEAQALAERTNTLESFAAWARSLFLFTNGGQAEEARGARVDWNHFDMLGAQAALGRTFVRDDVAASQAIILSHGLWQRRFGPDPAVASAARSVDAEVALLGPRLMTDVVDGTMGNARLMTSLLTLFGLGLEAIGVYGVTA